MTFAQKAISFSEELVYTGKELPPGISALNPFKESKQVMEIVRTFYNKYYNDQKPRHLILGINPGRFGGGMTGIPFTDPKRLASECQIPYEGKITHEPSSAFIYEMIHAYGGVTKFYEDFYINSPFPLILTFRGANGRERNCNYYDGKPLTLAVKGFMVENIHKLIQLGVDTDLCFCLGTGKNSAFLEALNEEHHFFKKMIALEHPRFIMQYKSAEKDFYIGKYLDAFKLIS